MKLKFFQITITAVSICLNGCFLNASVSKLDSLQATDLIHADHEKLVVPKLVHGNEGSTIAITISLAPNSEQKVYHYALVPGTAVNGVHYIDVPNIVSFNPGETQKIISIQTHEVGLPTGSMKDLTLKIYAENNTLQGETKIEILPVPQMGKISDLKGIRASSMLYQDMGTYILFVSQSSQYGSELWRSDGTPGGTYQLKDICPGACSSEISSFAQIGSTVYFVAKETLNGKYTLYKMDGTPVGTSKVFEAAQVSQAAGLEDKETFYKLPYYDGKVSSSTPRYLLASSNRLFFLLENSAAYSWQRYTWFSTQGTLGNTFYLASLDDSPRTTTIFNDQLLVTQEDEVFHWDGATNNGWTIINTSLGTPCNGDEKGTYQINNALYFRCYDLFSSPSGDRIFRVASGFTYTDTSRLSSSLPYTSGDGADYYYFTITNGPNQDLYRTDGTDAGTVKVLNGTSPLSTVLGNVNGKTILRSGTSLYQTDGTLAGTTQISALASTTVTVLGSVGGYLYYAADNNLHRTDGTSVGTSIVISTDSEPFQSATLIRAETTEIFFEGLTASRGNELWKISSSDGLQMVLELRTGVQNSNPGPVYKFLGHTYVAMPNDDGNSLYRIDGSLALSETVFNNWAPPAVEETVSSMIDFNGKLYWTQNSCNTQTEIQSYSVASGKQQEAILQTYNPSLTTPTSILGIVGNNIVVSGILSFSAHTSGVMYDTVNQTKITVPSFVPSSMNPLSNTKVIVKAKDSDSPSNSNYEPYVTDGTTVGTVKLAELVAGTTGSNPFFLGTLNNKVIFSTSLGLYETDGTPAGTVLIVQPNFTLAVADPIVLGNKIVFSAGTAATGRELWITDGTAMGTSLIKDIGPTTTSGFVKILAKNATNSLAFFTANDGTNGQELWTTDGTTAGTIMLSDFCSGVCTNLVNRMIEFKGKMYFTLTVPNPTPSVSTESQLWMTDGTSIGTTLFKDLVPNVVTQMHKNSTTLFFTIKDSLISDRTHLYRFKPSASNAVELYPEQSGFNPSPLGIFDNKLLFIDTSPTRMRKSLNWVK